MTKKSAAATALERLSDRMNQTAKNTQQVFPRSLEQEVKKGILMTKENFWNLWKLHSAGAYIIDDRNKDVIFTVFKYFLKDPDFNEAGLITTEPSLEKGLLIFGDYGVGKTLLFEILHKIARSFLDHGNKQMWFSCITASSFVEKYMSETKNPDSTFSLDSYSKGRLYIDDLGFEPKAFNQKEIMAQILFDRNRFGSTTFVTTNLKPSEIVERYGDRIGDRLDEMFNIIKWNGESFRK